MDTTSLNREIPAAIFGHVDHNAPGTMDEASPVGFSPRENGNVVDQRSGGVITSAVWLGLVLVWSQDYQGLLKTVSVSRPPAVTAHVTLHRGKTGVKIEEA